MILFVNGCARENSRTLDLAQAVISKLEDTVEEVSLFSDGPEGLTTEKLQLRDELLSKNDLFHPMFRWARQFAEADIIIIAAPYWDLIFPAKVRAYMEEVSVSGITFKYGENGIPKGLCRAKQLIYVTTAGGPIYRNFGFDYIEAMAKNFYGIPQVLCVKAEGLDIFGADPEKILADAKKSITIY